MQEDARNLDMSADQSLGGEQTRLSNHWNRGWRNSTTGAVLLHSNDILQVLCCSGHWSRRLRSHGSHGLGRRKRTKAEAERLKGGRGRGKLAFRLWLRGGNEGIVDVLHCARSWLGHRVALVLGVLWGEPGELSVGCSLPGLRAAIGRVGGFLVVIHLIFVERCWLDITVSEVA
jgi:hypothetical protein